MMMMIDDIVALMHMQINWEICPLFCNDEMLQFWKLSGPHFQFYEWHFHTNSCNCKYPNIQTIAAFLIHQLHWSFAVKVQRIKLRAVVFRHHLSVQGLIAMSIFPKIY